MDVSMVGVSEASLVGCDPKRGAREVGGGGGTTILLTESRWISWTGHRDRGGCLRCYMGRDVHFVFGGRAKMAMPVRGNLNLGR